MRKACGILGHLLGSLQGCKVRSTRRRSALRDGATTSRQTSETQQCLREAFYNYRIDYVRIMPVMRCPKLSLIVPFWEISRQGTVFRVERQPLSPVSDQQLVSYEDSPTLFPCCPLGTAEGQQGTAAGSGFSPLCGPQPQCSWRVTWIGPSPIRCCPFCPPLDPEGQPVVGASHQAGRLPTRGAVP